VSRWMGYKSRRIVNKGTGTSGTPLAPERGYRPKQGKKKKSICWGHWGTQGGMSDWGRSLGTCGSLFRTAGKDFFAPVFDVVWYQGKRGGLLRGLARETGPWEQEAWRHVAHCLTQLRGGSPDLDVRERTGAAKIVERGGGGLFSLPKRAVGGKRELLEKRVLESRDKRGACPIRSPTGPRKAIGRVISCGLLKKSCVFIIKRKLSP